MINKLETFLMDFQVLCTDSWSQKIIEGLGDITVTQNNQSIYFHS